MTWASNPDALPLPSGGAAIAAGRNGSIYVLATMRRVKAADPPSRSVLTLLNSTGAPRPGWPIELLGWVCDGVRGTSWPPQVAEDGSVRVVCAPDDPGDGSSGYRAYAFDIDGSPMPGWPVDISSEIADRPVIVDGQLHILASGPSRSVPSSTAYWIDVVDADGSVIVGSQFDPPATHAERGTPQLSPRGIGYYVADPAAGTEITVFGLQGARRGWPLRLDGFWSAPALDEAGRLWVVGEPALGHTQILGFESDGKAVPAEFEIPARVVTRWQGAGPSAPALVTTLQGSVFVLAEIEGRATVYGLDQGGDAIPGWPYASDGGLQTQGTCAGPDTGCGVWLVDPALDPGTELDPAPVLYLPVTTRDASRGGALTAIGVDGKVRPGWPVSLRQAGAAFWSVVVGSRGLVFAVAIEPGPDGESATILGLARDGTVLYRTTVVDPER